MFLTKRIFIKKKNGKNTHAYKKRSPQKRELPLQGAPTMKNSSYRIVTKGIWN